MISPAGILPAAGDRTELTLTRWPQGWRIVGLPLL